MINNYLCENSLLIENLNFTNSNSFNFSRDSNPFCKLTKSYSFNINTIFYFKYIKHLTLSKTVFILKSNKFDEIFCVDLDSYICKNLFYLDL